MPMGFKSEVRDSNHASETSIDEELEPHPVSSLSARAKIHSMV